MTSTPSDANVGTALAQEGVRAGVTMLELRYGLEDKPGLVQAVLFGLQHVLVMFTAMIASPLVIGQLLNLSPELRATMVTGVMLGCGIGTVIPRWASASSAHGCRCCSAPTRSTSGRSWPWRRPRASAPRPPR
jgi:Permease family